MSEDESLWHTSHFDLMLDYDGELPQHVVTYLNNVKTEKTADAIRALRDQTEDLVGLDVGCGTGNHALTLQELIPNCLIDGLDVSQRQLNMAREKGFPNRLVHAPMFDTGLADESYDFVVAVNSIHHLQSRDQQTRAFQEFHRLLRPNGIVVVHEINVTNPLMRFYMRHVFPRTRSIDNGTELFLTSLPINQERLIVRMTDHFTFVPDFTPQFLMGPLVALDKRLSRSYLSKLGAHVMWVLQRS